MQPIVIDIEADSMRAFHLRMQRVGRITLLLCLVVGVIVPIISVYLSIISLVTGVGLIFAVDTLLRARRGLAAGRSLHVTIERLSVTAHYEGAAPHVDGQPILSGQAFPDHLQLVAGTSPRPIFQLEIPIGGEERAQLLHRLRREQGVNAPDRRPFGIHLAFGLIVVPAIIIPAFLLLWLIGAAIEVGVVAGLMSLGPELGLSVMLLCALFGGLILLRRALKHR